MRLGQQGGWPLTMFLSPDGKPMVGGTYWPPEPRYGRPSFRQVLQSIANSWRTQRNEMESRGLTLADHLAKLSELNAGPGISPADLTRVGDALKSAVDPVHGGMRRRAEISQRADLPLLLERDVPPWRSVLRRGATRHAGSDERGRHL